MQARPRITEGSSLRDIARLLESIDAFERAMPATAITVEYLVLKSTLYSSAVRTASHTILRELDRIDWLYGSSISETLVDTLYVMAERCGWQSGTDDGEGPYSTAEDLRRLLTEPMPPALLLNVLCERFGVESLPEVAEACAALHAPVL